MNKEELESHIRDDFEDPVRQLVYADYLEEIGQADFSQFVRICTQLASSESVTVERSLREKWFTLLMEDPMCYSWENFLSLRKLDAWKEQLTERLKALDCDVAAPASLEEVEQAESELGFKLPVVYREFLLQVANGVGFRSEDGHWELNLFPAEELVQHVGKKFPQGGYRGNPPSLNHGNPLGEIPLSTETLITSSELGINQNVFRGWDGMLLIGEELKGTFGWEQKLMLVTSPPLNGLMIYCDSLESQKLLFSPTKDAIPTTIRCLEGYIEHVGNFIESANEASLHFTTEDADD